MIEIDGSQGEGGGQVLRTSLALSVHTGQPVRFTHIRANRPKPGLGHQHLASLRAAAAISHADLTGDALKSSTVTFTPRTLTPGDYHFDVGTAGSAALVLQTVLPPLLAASAPSTVTVTGGTHNQWAPPVDFLQHTFLPLLARLGPHVRLTLVRPGFAPKGGGTLRAEITPAPLTPLDLLERGRRTTSRAVVYLANLPLHIAEREAQVIRDRLRWTDVEIREVDADGPGNAVVLAAGFEHVTEVVTAFGQRGRSAERVANGACRELNRYLKHDHPVGEYLADQALLVFALAGGGRFLTRDPSGHTRTQEAVIPRFLPVQIHAHPRGADTEYEVQA